MTHRKFIVEGERIISTVESALEQHITNNTIIRQLIYKAIGKHFNGNPYDMAYDILVPHGHDIIHLERTFNGIKEYLNSNGIEGIVFWLNNEPMCKIKRNDFDFEWTVKDNE